MSSLPQPKLKSKSPGASRIPLPFPLSPRHEPGTAGRTNTLEPRMSFLSPKQRWSAPGEIGVQGPKYQLVDHGATPSTSIPTGTQAGKRTQDSTVGKMSATQVMSKIPKSTATGSAHDKRAMGKKTKTTTKVTTSIGGGQSRIPIRSAVRSRPLDMGHHVSGLTSLVNTPARTTGKAGTMAQKTLAPIGTAPTTVQEPILDVLGWPEMLPVKHLDQTRIPLCLGVGQNGVSTALVTLEDQEGGSWSTESGPAPIQDVNTHDQFEDIHFGGIQQPQLPRPGLPSRKSSQLSEFSIYSSASSLARARAAQGKPSSHTPSDDSMFSYRSTRNQDRNGYQDREEDQNRGLVASSQAQAHGLDSRLSASAINPDFGQGTRSSESFREYDHERFRCVTEMILEYEHNQDQDYDQDPDYAQHYDPNPNPSPTNHLDPFHSEEGAYIVPSTGPPMTLEWLPDPESLPNVGFDFGGGSADGGSEGLDEAEEVWKKLEVKMGRRLRGSLRERGRWVVKASSGMAFEGGLDMDGMGYGGGGGMDGVGMGMERVESEFSVSAYMSFHPASGWRDEESFGEGEGDEDEEEDGTALFDMSAPLVPSVSSIASTPFNTPSLHRESLHRSSRVCRSRKSTASFQQSREANETGYEDMDVCDLDTSDARHDYRHPDDGYYGHEKSTSITDERTPKPGERYQYRLDSHIISALSAMQGNMFSPELDLALGLRGCMSPEEVERTPVQLWVAAQPRARPDTRYGVVSRETKEVRGEDEEGNLIEEDGLEGFDQEYPDHRRGIETGTDGMDAKHAIQGLGLGLHLQKDSIYTLPLHPQPNRLAESLAHRMEKDRGGEEDEEVIRFTDLDTGRSRCVSVGSLGLEEGI